VKALETVIGFFQRGGPFMYPILFVALAGLSIMIERLIVILFRNRIDTATFVNAIITHVRRGRIDRAIEMCNYSKAALPQIALAGLEEFSNSADDIQGAMERKAMKVIPRLEKRTGYLSMIANVATLLGLLGTVIGLIQAFQAVAQADAAQKAALLSHGISVAMNTTAFGLMVAIPCMIGYSFISEKTNELIDEINESTASIFKTLVDQKRQKGI